MGNSKRNSAAVAIKRNTNRCTSVNLASANAHLLTTTPPTPSAPAPTPKEKPNSVTITPTMATSRIASSYHGYTGGHVSFKIANNGKNDCTVYHNNGTGRRYDNKHDYKLSQIVCAGQAACGCMCHSKYSCTLTHHHTSGYKRAFNHC